jgi:hypothetical protein
MDAQLGPAYSRSWAADTVLVELGERTVSQALEQGEPASLVWRAVAAHLGLPKNRR